MSYEPSEHLWAPQRRGVLATIDALNRGKNVVLQAATGGGKTQMAIELFRWAQSQGLTGSFCVNRKLLVAQTSARFASAGLPHAVRAAEYDDMYDPSQPFQVCSVDSEMARAYNPKRMVWSRFNAGLVVVDEAHIQKGKKMGEYLADQKARGARVVLLSATPVGLSGMADELVVSGTMSEYRACGALVPAVVKSISNPDMHKVKRNKTGEYVMGDRSRAIYTQTIVGDVLDRWKKYNPDARPTMLYAPGKAESVWFTEQFANAGVRFCHVDATEACIFENGKAERIKLNRTTWQQVLDDYVSGRILGLSSRFKLREGIDVTSTYCCILATPIGSLASYLQTVGRVLRRSEETPDQVLVIDHGGNYLRHGSPNHDRPWSLWWTLPENAVSEMHTNQIRNGKEPEPIRCPKCEGERLGGSKCPHCGFEHQKSVRNVIMEDGTFETHEGRLIPKRRVKTTPDTEKDWSNMFWAFRRKKLDKSFAQLYAFFKHEKGYAPPRDMKFMPKTEHGWYQKVHLASFDELHGTRASGDAA